MDVEKFASKLINLITTATGAELIPYVILIPRLDLSNYTWAAKIPNIYFFSVKSGGMKEQDGQDSTTAPVPTLDGVKNMSYQNVGRPSEFDYQCNISGSLFGFMADLMNEIGIPYDKPSLQMIESFKDRVKNGNMFMLITPKLTFYPTVSVASFTNELDLLSDMPAKISGSSSNFLAINCSLSLKELLTFDMQGAK